jgi:signal transduction histidine kinase
MREASHLSGMPIGQAHARQPRALGLSGDDSRGVGSPTVTGPARGWVTGAAAAHTPARCTPGLLQLILDLTALRDPGEILELAVRETPMVLGVSAVAVRIDRPGAPGGCDVVCDANHRDVAWIEAAVRTDRGIARASTGRIPVRVAITGAHLAGDTAQPAGRCRPVLVVPIRSAGRLHGSLVLIDKPGAIGFGLDDRDLAATLAVELAVILDNATAHHHALARLRELDEANTALLRARDDQSRYLRNVLHELRTPLHSIILATQLLDDPAIRRLERERIRSLWMTIEDSGRHLLGLVDDLADVSRDNGPDLGLQLLDTDIGPILDEVRRLVRPLSEAKGLRLAIARGSGIRARLDPLRFRQVLLNLLSNAVKYTQPGGRIQVTAVSRAGCVVIEVRDTGDGMPADAVERAFEPFERLGRVDVDGIGLGLAIARRIAELHGGTLTATSLPGTGSTFILRLPAIRDVRPEPRTGTAVSSLSSPSSTPSPALADGCPPRADAARRIAADGATPVLAAVAD